MRILTAVLCTMLLAGMNLAQADDTTLDKKIWHQDLQKAHVLAQQENKPILIVFGATWCKFCKKLEQETLSDPQMQRFVQDKFIPVHLDLDEEAKIGRILEIKSLPCTVVLSPKADLLGKVVGYKDTVAMKEQLEKALQTGQVLQQASGEKLVK